jgi:hypothetical protein
MNKLILSIASLLLALSGSIALAAPTCECQNGKLEPAFSKAFYQAIVNTDCENPGRVESATPLQGGGCDLHDPSPGTPAIVDDVAARILAGQGITGCAPFSNYFSYTYLGDAQTVLQGARQIVRNIEADICGDGH